MPPELKQLEEALQKSGLNDNHDVDQLAFALFRASDAAKDTDNLSTVGIARANSASRMCWPTSRSRRSLPQFCGPTGSIL